MTDIRSCKNPILSFHLLYFFPISLVLVGGDGFYHEAVNSLERRLMEEDGLDKDIADIGLRALPLPIGIIPAGKSSKINDIYKKDHNERDIEQFRETTDGGRRDRYRYIRHWAQGLAIAYWYHTSW